MVTTIVPNEHLDTVNALCSNARGERDEITSIDEERVMAKWRLPLAEVVIDFFDTLKRLTSGYASFGTRNIAIYSHIFLVLADNM